MNARSAAIRPAIKLPAPSLFLSFFHVPTLLHELQTCENSLYIIYLIDSLRSSLYIIIYGQCMIFVYSICIRLCYYYIVHTCVNVQRGHTHAWTLTPTPTHTHTHMQAHYISREAKTIRRRKKKQLNK